ENLSGAFGNWMDDSEWLKCAAMFARGGARDEYMAGFYVGPEHVAKAEVIFFGNPPATPRTGGQLHSRIQPVIEVSPDGHGAKLSTYLFHLNTSFKNAGTFSSG